MLPTKLLIANRGEIAIRLIRAAAELGIETVAIHTEDDAESLHVRKADHVRGLRGRGPRGYLDGAQILAVATELGCDALHPGYGFLSENAAFARACAAAGVRFIGPRPEILELFGDKAQARALAQRLEVPLLAGVNQAVDVAAAEDFVRSLGHGGAAVIKAVAGGGGRGIRVVRSVAEVAEAHARCASEALAAFGSSEVYIEQYLPVARHIEVQILGDGTGNVAHLGERDCSIQRRHQKIIEITPSPGLAPAVRSRILAAALKMASAIRYDNVGTFEFLLDAGDSSDAARFAFIEANARLQVEHTITEEVAGVDLVEAQLRLASGQPLESLGLPRDFASSAWAMQLRINMETVSADGTTLPASGVIERFEMPSGKGIRVDGYGYVGYHTNPAFDSLLAKLIIQRRAGTWSELLAKTYRALSECRIAGVATNIGFLQDLLLAPPVTAGRLSTRLLDEHVAGGSEQVGAHRQLYFDRAEASHETRVTAATAAPPGTSAVPAPMVGTVILVCVQVGESIVPGQLLAVIEAMKMEHEVKAASPAIVRQIGVVVGSAVRMGEPMLFVDETGAIDTTAQQAVSADLDQIRPDLAEVLERQAATRDVARPQAVARRHAKGQRTARENIADLVDPDTFVEYGALTLANQEQRRTRAELIEKSPADGLITGVGSVNGPLFGDPIARCAVMVYDYTVFAGTQGIRNHLKTDRLIRLAEKGRLPFVLFAEGGGGRPGDDGDTGERCDTFAMFAKLSGLVPMIGIVSGRCYAGNAALLGCCDVIIATTNTNIGMGGPAMIEGGGLGVYAPEDIGPIDVQTASGVVDVTVADEAAAVAIAKQYLAYFQGRTREWQAHDQRTLRHLVPENRLRAYDMRRVLHTLADVDSLLELRPAFGVGMITAFARIEGRTIGIIANNPQHLGGAIDADGADKAARFMQLCDAFDIPLLNLCDTPGIMVGPDVEKTALVRHSSRIFLVAANLTVPCFTIIVRKVYGLGGFAMAGGSLRVNTFTIAWPTGEWGPMGLEGAVRLGYRNELAAIADPIERKQYFDAMVEREHQRGKALELATSFGLDDVIDPAESRFWIANILASLRPPTPRADKKRPFVDSW